MQLVDLQANVVYFLCVHEFPLDTMLFYYSPKTSVSLVVEP